MRTSGDAIRANMRGVDPGLWDWCAKYVAYTGNRLSRRKGKPSPFEDVLRPTIGPNKAKAIKPVKRLSLIEETKKFFLIYTFSISGLPKNPVG